VLVFSLIYVKIIIACVAARQLSLAADSSKQDCCWHVGCRL